MSGYNIGAGPRVTNPLSRLHARAAELGIPVARIERRPGDVWASLRPAYVLFRADGTSVELAETANESLVALEELMASRALNLLRHRADAAGLPVTSLSRHAHLADGEPLEALGYRLILEGDHVHFIGQTVADAEKAIDALAARRSKPTRKRKESNHASQPA